MAQVLLTNAQVIINSVDLSNRIDSVAIDEVWAVAMLAICAPEGLMAKLGA